MRKKIQYVLVVQKSISLVGEALEIRTNLPAGASSDAIYTEIAKITAAMDKRMEFAQVRAIKNEKKILEEKKKNVALENQIRESVKKNKLKYN